MNGRKLFLSIFFSTLLVFLLVSATSGDPRDRKMPPNHRPPMPRGTGMVGGSEYMDIAGSVSIDDGITISLTVTPTEEMVKRMEDRTANAPIDVAERSIENFTNTLNITLYP